MSLVNEALKKARLEAARQDAARRGLPLPGMQTAPRPQGIAPATLMRVGAVAVLIAAGVLIFLAGRRSGDGPMESVALAETRLESVPAPLPEESPRETSVPRSGGSESVERIGSEPPAEPPTAPPATPAPSVTGATPSLRTAEPPAVGSPTTGLPRVTSPAAETSASDQGDVRTRPKSARPRPARERTGGAAESAEPQAYVRKLELAGSRALELGGIAWSEDRPFALINGRVVGPGDQVETLVVVSVEPRHVELRGEEGHFLLLLK